MLFEKLTIAVEETSTFGIEWSMHGSTFWRIYLCSGAEGQYCLTQSATEGGLQGHRKQEDVCLQHSLHEHFIASELMCEWLKLLLKRLGLSNSPEWGRSVSVACECGLAEWWGCVCLWLLSDSRASHSRRLQDGHLRCVNAMCRCPWAHLCAVTYISPLMHCLCIYKYTCVQILGIVTKIPANQLWLPDK